MALVGVELETLVSEPDALTTRPPPFALLLSIAHLRAASCFVAELLNLKSPKRLKLAALIEQGIIWRLVTLNESI